MGKGEEEISVGGSGSQKKSLLLTSLSHIPPLLFAMQKNPSESPLRIHRYGKTQFSSSPSTTKGVEEEEEMTEGMKVEIGTGKRRRRRGRRIPKPTYISTATTTKGWEIERRRKIGYAQQIYFSSSF